MQAYVSFQKVSSVLRRALPELSVVAAVAVGAFLLAGSEDVRSALGYGPGHTPAAVAGALAVLAATTGLGVRRWVRLRREMARCQAAEAALLSAKEEAEALARLRSSYLASVSHEVRTPLSGIIGFATMLEEELSGERREMAQIIRDSGERLLDTLNSVLDMARLEAGAVAVYAEPCDVLAEIEASARLFRCVAADKGIYLHTEAPDAPVTDAPVTVWADRTFLHRILTNLLSNAVKYTATGGVTVRVSSADGHVAIAVADTGIGISEAVLPHIFDAFVQEEAGLSRTHTGSGLGLAITRRLVGQIGGTVEVRSRKGEGSTFTLILPAFAGVPTGRPEPAAAEPVEILQ